MRFLTICRQMQEGCEYALARCHDSALAMQHVLQSMYITLQVCRFQVVIHFHSQYLKPSVGCCAEHSHDMVCVCLQQRAFTPIEFATCAVWQAVLSRHVHADLQDAYHMMVLLSCMAASIA